MSLALACGLHCCGAMRLGDTTEQDRLRRLHGLRNELAEADTLEAVAQVLRDVGEMVLGARVRLWVVERGAVVLVDPPSCASVRLDDAIVDSIKDGQPRWQPDVRSCVLPLVVRGVIGAIDLSFEHTVYFDGIERAFLAAVAQLVGDSVDRIQPVEQVTARRLRVLIVHHDPANATELGEAIEALGHEAVVVYNEHAALRAAQEFDAHIALVDLAVPRIEAGELAARLRRAPHWQTTRLVAIVGNNESTTGFDQALTRPVPLDQIAALLVA